MAPEGITVRSIATKEGCCVPSASRQRRPDELGGPGNRWGSRPAKGSAGGVGRRRPSGQARKALGRGQPPEALAGLLGESAVRDSTILMSSASGSASVHPSVRSVPCSMVRRLTVWDVEWGLAPHSLCNCSICPILAITSSVGHKDGCLNHGRNAEYAEGDRGLQAPTGQAPSGQPRRATAQVLADWASMNISARLSWKE